MTLMNVEPIKTKVQYNKALKEAEKLIDANVKKGTAKGNRLQILAALIGNYEVNHVLDMQRKRMTAAEKLWQKETNQPHVLPDLGDLLEWLMKRRELVVRHATCTIAKGFEEEAPVMSVDENDDDTVVKYKCPQCHDRITVKAQVC